MSEVLSGNNQNIECELHSYLKVQENHFELSILEYLQILHQASVKKTKVQVMLFFLPSTTYDIKDPGQSPIQSAQILTACG